MVVVCRSFLRASTLRVDSGSRFGCTNRSQVKTLSSYYWLLEVASTDGCQKGPGAKGPGRLVHQKPVLRVLVSEYTDASHTPPLKKIATH